jgi:hypothetical protein
MTGRSWLKAAYLSATCRTVWGVTQLGELTRCTAQASHHQDRSRAQVQMAEQYFHC